MARLAAGSRLGRYEIVRPVGAGAMGEVYLAEDPQIGRQLAIKTVRVEEGRAHEIEERKRRLLREARAAGRLLHPNIVALFDAGEDQEVLYLAFEWVDGSDLSTRVAAGPPLSLGEALAVVRQTAEALDYAHRQGVVHRDIKPSNVMITRQGQVKVADFGIAKVADQTSDLTMTGSVVGSPHYLSPEQIRGEALDGRSDIFSLGVLLYEILCHRRPFEGETLTTLVYQILHQEPTSPTLARADLGPRVEALVRRMLHKDRDQRFATAADVAREVAACERELAPAQLAAAAAPEGENLEATRRMGPETPPPPSATAATTVTRPAPPPPPPPAAPPPAAAAATVAAPRGRSPLLVAGVVVGLLALVGVGALVATKALRGGRPAPPPAVPSDVVPTPTPRPLPAAPTPAPTGTATAEAVPLVQPVGTPPISAPTPEPTPAATPTPAAAPIRPAPTRVAPTPEPTPAATPEPEPEPAEPVVDRPAIAPNVDRVMVTGMALSFDVEPEDAIVRVGRIVIGQAKDWNAKKRDGRAYDLPGPGEHIVRVMKEGKLYVIRVMASETAPSPTLVQVELEPKKGKRPRRGGS